MGKIITILIIFGVIIIGGYYGYKFFKSDNPPAAPETEKKVENKTAENNEVIMKTLALKSSAFENMGKIPVKYTCDDQSLIPPLEILGVDDNAKSLVLIMYDPDAPVGVFDHWLKFNLPATLSEIKEGTDPGGVSGSTSAKKLKYVGPCPPDREHRYFFKLYSLDIMLNLPEGATKTQIESAMQSHILQQAELVGLYNRQ